MRAISAPVEAEDTERSAGFLTKTEREYLVGSWAPGDSDPGEWSKQQERTKRSDIKTRTRHAMADIALLQQYGSDELTKNVIMDQRSPDDEIPIFYDETIENAKNGLSEFLIRLALEPEQADGLVNYLHNEDWAELFEDMSKSVEESKQTAQEHQHFIKPVTQKLQEYAHSNDLSKEEMKDAIDIHWSE